MKNPGAQEQDASEISRKEVDGISCCEGNWVEEVWGIHPLDRDNMQERHSVWYTLIARAHPDRHPGCSDEFRRKANEAT